ncbi:MAG: triose-phosphate isomerase [Patescibacteria group bacterium]
MAKPVLIANWKNYPSSFSEAKNLLGQLSRDRKFYKKLSLFIAPPLPYLESVALKSKGFARLAIQDTTNLSGGTYTGVVTPDILKSFGVGLVILGHSEQRALGETNEAVSQKVITALRSGFTPLVCVGELSRDQEGRHFEFLREQLKSSLAGLNKKTQAAKLAIAYEPVWAIGKSAIEAIGPSDLSESTIFIKKVLSDMFGRSTADRIPILYGGSVEPANAKTLFSKTGVKGYLVGHASLSAKNFKAIAIALTSK